MNVTSFLATVANNYRLKMLNLANSVQYNQTPSYYTSSADLNSPSSVNNFTPIDKTEKTEPEETENSTQKVDRYEPSNEAVQNSREAEGKHAEKRHHDDDHHDKHDNDHGHRANDVEKKPDGTYYYKRKAELDYKLDLRFDLAAITRTVEQLADGETQSLESLAAAGFGFSTDFSIKGKQSIKTNMGDEESGHMRIRSKSKASSERTGNMMYRDNDFALDSSFSESEKVRRSLDVKVRGAHRKAVNKFAARFKMDNNFSFGFVERLNVQTKQVADEAPNSVESYLNSAGALAESGSNELMAGFFDAVDGYLDKTEDAVLDKVMAFFDRAAEELGFSGAAVEMARDHLTNTIESFFDRVETALASVEATFNPVVEPAEPEVELPANNFAVEPDPKVTLPAVEMYNPETAEAQRELAVG